MVKTRSYRGNGQRGRMGPTGARARFQIPGLCVLPAHEGRLSSDATQVLAAAYCTLSLPQTSDEVTSVMAVLAPFPNAQLEIAVREAGLLYADGRRVWMAIENYRRRQRQDDFPTPSGKGGGGKGASGKGDGGKGGGGKGGGGNAPSGVQH
jgi:uncharacterized membrane protein YgcG